MRAFRTAPPLLSRVWWLWAGLVLAGALAGNLCVLHNPYLWFDEAGQFFISLGLSHWSPPDAQPAGLEAMLHYHNKYLFDPFGYTLLFRVWQEVGTAAPWLRVLPFLGFCGLLFSGYRFLRLSGVRGPVSLLLIALVPSSPLLYQYAGELRPYIFEAWGAAFCGCVLLRYGRTTGLRYPLLAGGGMSAFLWMRYPFVMAAGITGFLLLVQMLLVRPAGGWKRFLVYALPQVISAIAIYFLCIRQQPISPQMPPYGMPTTLKYNPAFLLHPWTMAYHFLVAGFLLLAVFHKKLIPESSLKLGRWAFFTALLFAAWSFFSAAGKLSSDPNARWGIELNAVAVLCGLLLLAALLEKISPRYLPAAFLVLGVLALYRPVLQTARWAAGDAVRFRGEVYVQEMAKTAQQYKGKIWSPSGSTPEIKYLFEWGSLRAIRRQARYPQHFVFLNQQNEFGRINKWPLKKRMFWVDYPGRYTAKGRHKSKPADSSTVFYWLWRTK